MFLLSLMKRSAERRVCMSSECVYFGAMLVSVCFQQFGYSTAGMYGERSVELLAPATCKQAVHVCVFGYLTFRCTL
jgi:hypothetical protein